VGLPTARKIGGSSLGKSTKGETHFSLPMRGATFIITSKMVVGTGGRARSLEVVGKHKSLLLQGETN